MLGRVTRQGLIIDKTDKIPAYVEYIFSPRTMGNTYVLWTIHTHSTHTMRSTMNTLIREQELQR